MRIRKMKSSKVSKLRKKPHGKQGSSEERKLKKRNKSADKAVPQTPPSADQQTAISTSEVFSVRISKIVVGERLREGNKATVAVITESIRELGQLSPIWLRKKEVKGPKTGKTSIVRVLIAGWHRIEAMKALGEKMIDAVYLDVDEEGATLVEISENLDRGGLTVLERAEHIDKKVQIIRARRRAARTAGPGGHQPADKSISAAARELGHTKEDIRRSGLVAGISDPAKARAKELGLDDNERALLRIEKGKQPDKQVAIAEQLGNKKERTKKPADAASREEDEATYEELETAWERATKCQRAYREATENARRKFKRMLESIPLPKKADDGEEDGDDHDDDDEKDW
jgi:ParB-like chromosome segregation protein Spo0J